MKSPPLGRAGAEAPAGPLLCGAPYRYSDCDRFRHYDRYSDCHCYCHYHHYSDCYRFRHRYRY